MITIVRFLALIGPFLAVACTQHSNGTQRASVFSFPDTISRDFDARRTLTFIEANPQTIVLDVRTPEEYAMGHLISATNLNLYEAKFVTNLAKLDRSKTYVVHCAAGLPNGRSRKAMTLLDSLGFKQIHHLNGGFNGWRHAELPVITSN